MFSCNYTVAVELKHGPNRRSLVVSFRRRKPEGGYSDQGPRTHRNQHKYHHHSISLPRIAAMAREGTRSQTGHSKPRVFPVVDTAPATTRKKSTKPKTKKKAADKVKGKGPTGVTKKKAPAKKESGVVKKVSPFSPRFTLCGACRGAPPYLAGCCVRSPRSCDGIRQFCSLPNRLPSGFFVAEGAAPKEAADTTK